VPKRPGATKIPDRLKTQIVEELLHRDKGTTVTSVCKKYGISRETAYSWLKLRREQGLYVPGLATVTELATGATVLDERPAPSLQRRLITGDGPAPRSVAKLNRDALDGLDDFGFFRKTYIGRSSPAWAVEAANKLLELYHSDQEEYLVLNVAPGAGKSTLVTHDFVVWVIARERAFGQEPTISLGHRTTNKALWYLHRLQSTFTHNVHLIADYGRFRPPSRTMRWSREEMDVEPLELSSHEEKEPTISAAAYEASILSGRYGLIIWDDLVDKANSSTLDARTELVRWWDQEAESRLNTGGLIVLSGARYGPEDLFNHAITEVDIDEEEGDGVERKLFERIVFPAHFEDRCDGEHTREYPEGCMLDLARVSWRKVRRYMVKDEGRFRLVWQQEDVDPKGFLAEKVFFTGGVTAEGFQCPGCFDDGRRFGDLRTGGSPMLSVLTLDPSPARFWGVQHWVVYPEGLQWLVRGMRQMLQAPELLYVDTAGGGFTGILDDWWNMSVATGVPYTYLVAEVNTANRWLLQYPFVSEWAAARGITIVRHTTGTNKADPERGVEMLGPLYRAGQVSFPYGGLAEKTYADAFAREACSWPEGSSTDQVMAHWFLNAKLPTMVMADANDDAMPFMGPAWAHTRAPGWVSDSLAHTAG
jgi:transposase-like protein